MGSPPPGHAPPALAPWAGAVAIAASLAAGVCWVIEVGRQLSG